MKSVQRKTIESVLSKKVSCVQSKHEKNKYGKSAQIKNGKKSVQS